MKAEKEQKRQETGRKEDRPGHALNAEHGGIVVLDFGGQYTQLIARRVREQGVFSAILPCTTSVEETRGLEPAGFGVRHHSDHLGHPGAVGAQQETPLV